MEHILTSCKAKARELAWNMVNDLWSRCSNTPLPHRLGDILGCGLTEHESNSKPDEGKNRLYHILMSEMVYMIWRMRNEKRIRDKDSPDCEASERKIHNRWTHALNKHLTVDCALTDSIKFSKRALNEKLVKKMWSSCLNNEEELPSDWFRLKEVLVGIFFPCPPGYNR